MIKIIRIIKWIVPVPLLLILWFFGRKAMFPSVPAPDPKLIAQAKSVRILRDDWGVAHIFGKTDADTAFGLAYAHAQDDFPLIQGALVAARGKLGLLMLSKEADINDYYVQMFRIWRQIDEQYEKELSLEMRAVLEGYASGLNHYAALHPDEVDSRFLPYSGKDVAAGFLHKLPLFLHVDKPMKALNEAEDLRVGDPVVNHDEDRRNASMTILASNAFAVGRKRSADGITRININSHQPWEGPVAWYEVHLVSQEGWNMTGGTFPGAPIIFHGHNDHMGWAHTVNRPDQVDVYKLSTNPENENEYKFDGRWRKLEISEAEIELDLGLFNWTFHRKVFHSIHGPVIKTDHGFYALRYAGINQMIRAVEQWYRMNKAHNFKEWRQAMKMQAVPLFNTVYADRKNIYYVYNALLPKRNKDYKYDRILPGDTSKALWYEYLPYKKLPRVKNPAADFVQNCNSSPFHTTMGKGNPDPKKYSPNLGIEKRMTNRALRSLELLGGDESITRDEFFRYKWDRAYAKNAPIFIEAINPVLQNLNPGSNTELRGLELLRNWNGRTDGYNRAAALAILTYQPIWKAVIVDRKRKYPNPHDTFRESLRFLMDNFDRLDVPLGTVQRLQRDDTNLSLGGGPDVLNAIHSRRDGGKLIGWAGDSYILIVEFTREGVRSWSLHQYGNSNRPGSAHYNDQAPLFVKRTLRKTLQTEREIRERMEIEYHPGEEIDL